MKHRGDIPIVICCAEDDEPVLAKVVDELRREGLSPELVPGIEFDVELLTAAVDAAAPDALFVLCGSVALDRAALRRLTGLFSARSGPGQRIISASFTPSRPLAMLPAIRGAIKEMRLVDERADPDEPQTSHLRDVVEAFVDPPMAPRRADVAARPTDPRGEPTPPRTAPGPVTAPPSRPLVTPGQGGPRGAIGGSGVGASTTPGAGARTATPAVGSDIGAPLAVIDEDNTRSLERRLAGVPSMPDSMVSTDMMGSSAHIPRAAASRSAMFDEPRGNRLLLLFAGVGIAGILALAAMQLLQPRTEPAPSRAPARTAAAPESTTTTTIASANAPAAVVAPTVPAEAPAVPAPATPGGTAEAPAGTDVAPIGTDASPPQTPTATPPSISTPPAAPGVQSRRDLDLAALELGVTEGKLVRLGRLWATRGAVAEDTTWDDAVRRCRSRRINGMQGFRLPGARELRKLRAARVITAGTYWTRDTYGAGDEAIAFDGATGVTSEYPTTEPAGHALCVRLR